MQQRVLASFKSLSPHMLNPKCMATVHPSLSLFSLGTSIPPQEISMSENEKIVISNITGKTGRRGLVDIFGVRDDS